MTWRFSRALARTPASTFARGITSAALGAPGLDAALAQHRAYLSALRDAGVQITLLDADDVFPDSAFVEDTAIVANGRAIVTLPGAQSRAGETTAVRAALARYFDDIASIVAPGTLDGGDVCEAEDRVFVGISHRTNREGAEQLAAWFRRAGTETVFVEIRDLEGILHLKSGMSYLGDGLYVVDEALKGRIPLDDALTMVPDAEEAYGANCIRVNDVVLLAAGYSRLQDAIEKRVPRVVALDMSEYRKMDGGLSCLSIRF